MLQGSECQVHAGREGLAAGGCLLTYIKEDVAEGDQ